MSGGPRTFTGARAIVSIAGSDGKPVAVGVFNNVSYNVSINIQPVETLGSLLPRELAQTSQDAVAVTASGFRVIKSGPYTNNLVPTVDQLLRWDGVTLTIMDRQPASGPQNVLTVKDAKCTGYRSSVGAKNLADLEVSYLGIVATDETASQSDMTDSTAVPFPSATTVGN